MKKKYPILVIDDDKNLSQMLARLLRKGGFEHIAVCNDALQATKIIPQKPFGTILLDITMPDKSGTELLEELGEQFPDIPVIITTGKEDINTVVSCIKSGAFDYLVKPVQYSRLNVAVNAAMEVFSLRAKVSELDKKVSSDAYLVPSCFDEIVTRHPVMLELFKYVEAVSKTPFPILILGETGTGKELFARAIHKASERQGKLVTVNVAGLDDNLFTDTLFGHVKGAFSGADYTREGMVAQAQGGTFFLDEIGDLYPHSQVKLLRLIQEGEYYPIGSDKKLKSDARIVAATNCDLKELVDEKKIRSDLFHRLGAHVVEIPPLRERVEDLPLLTRTFVKEVKDILKSSNNVDPERLLRFIDVEKITGNVRELRSLIFDLVAKHEHDLAAPDKALAPIDPLETETLSLQALQFDDFPTLTEMEETLIHEALRIAGGKQGPAAKLLGISRQALNQRLTRKKQTQ